MQNQQRRILPPGVQDDIVFGILWVKVGALKTVRPTIIAYKVNIQFWGQRQPFTTFTSQENSAVIQYDVKCPITFFEKYLIDMNKNLKIQVENLGFVVLDLTKYLKKKLTLHNKEPFDRFKGFFQVVGKYGKKVASLELEFCANFNPQIALQELQEQEQILVCPAQKILNSPIKIAQEEEAQPHEDNRIANSLNNSPNTAKFDEKRYIDKQMISPFGNQHFPTVEKILTYSNLRLQKQASLTDKIQEKVLQIKDKFLQNQKVVSGKATPTGKTSRNIENETKKEKTSKSIKEQQQIPKKQTKERSKSREKPIPQIIIPTKKQIKQIPKIKQTKQQIQHDFYLMNRQPNMHEMSAVQKVDESISVDAQRQILSRVVNLNEELQKQKVLSPKKYPLKETSQQKNIRETNMKCYELPVHLFPNQMNQMQAQKRRTSNLLLNIVIQVNTQSVKFNKNAKFLLSYRPYGQKQNIKTGPLLPANFLIMFPAGQLQVLKMNKIPFILQFWNANQGQLLGLLKVSFLKIYKGFILQGRLNELAIKTNIIPTTIFKGEHQIVTLTEKKIGSCFITAHIGTTSQIHAYLNALRSEQNKNPLPKENYIIEQPSEKKQDKKQMKQIRKKGYLPDFTNFLGEIDSNKNLIVEHLIKFMNLKQSSFQQFQQLLDNFQFKGGNFYPMIEQKGIFQCKELSYSFQDYKIIKERINEKMSKTILSLLKEEKDLLIDKVKEKSNFGMLSHSGLKQALKDQKYGLILKILGSTIETQQFLPWIQNADKLSLKNIIISEEESILKVFQEIFFQQCKNSIQTIESILQNKGNTNEMSLHDVKPYFLCKNKKAFSLWFWLHLKILIYKDFKENNVNQKIINTAILYNWIVLKQKEHRQHQEDQIYKKQTIDFQQKHKESLQKQQQQVEQNYHSSQNKQKENIIDKSNKESMQIINHNKKNYKKQHEESKESNQKKPQQQILQHKFVIIIEELQLQDSFNGQCIVLYRFPFEEDQISSRKVQLVNNKHKYKLQCTGTHKFSLNEPIEQYLGESTVKFRVTIGKDELYGDLHSQELMTHGTQFRIIPLFSLKAEGIIGKLKMRVSYEKRLTSQLLLGKETIRDVFLPKNGYLNFELSTNVDQKKIRQQLNIKEEFYLQMSIDIFGENQTLSPHFPPFNSKLYSDFTSPFTINGSFKISLSPQILMHLKDGNCTAKLLMIYYAKQHGHYQRKEIVIANFKAPLLSVIKEEGLRGDYAFKNKLGMFVSLASCTIKYEKQPKHQMEVDNHLLSDPSRESYWLIINFLEILNYEGDLGWLKFEIVYQGKRYSTDQQNIRQLGVYDLQNKVLSLQMGSEQFSSTKILAININTAHQHFGIDINLRPIAKVLAKQKYFSDNNYFITVDDQSKLRKLRIGAKIYAFRGSSVLNHFAEAIQKNSFKEDEEYILKEDHYHENLQKLRKKLKLSVKTYEEILSVLLDKRKKEKLKNQLFNMKFYPNLDLTPIITFRQSDLTSLIEELSSSVSQQQFLQYLEESGIKFINLRPEFLERYSFNSLNYNKLDQNIDYLGLHKEIDIIVFAKKVRLQDNNKNQTFLSKEKEQKSKHVRISIIRGYNFHFLYNGIKPNTIIKLPDIGLETQIIERSSEPIFNEHMNFEMQGNELKKVKVQVYHQAGEEMEDILIGQGMLSLAQSLNNVQLPNSKIYKVVITSAMSNKMKATLDIKVQISQGKESVEYERNDSELEQSVGDSMIQEAMNKMNNISDYRRKAQLFQSSDQD